jgi:hypothetical protein
VVVDGGADRRSSDPDDHPADDSVRGGSSMINVTGEAAKDVVKGLSGNPLMLGLLCLNVLGVGAAVWYLEKINGRNAELFSTLLKSCIGGTT